MNPDTNWKVLEPGIIHLPTIGFRILYEPNGSFAVEWNGQPRGRCGTLSTAKSHVDYLMCDLLAMGMEP